MSDEWGHGWGYKANETTKQRKERLIKKVQSSIPEHKGKLSREAAIDILAKNGFIEAPRRRKKDAVSDSPKVRDVRAEICSKGNIC